MSDVPRLPGQDLERAAADVASEAGKGLAKALGKLANSAVGSWTAGMDARATDKKRTISHAGKLRRRKEEEEARREHELREIEHAAVMGRALGRLRSDMIDEQLKLEALTQGAFRRIEMDPDRGDAADIDPDWLRRFFKYASQTDEATILQIFEAVLADAAIAGRPALPAKALDTLRFFDLRSFEMFKRAAGIIGMFGHCDEQILTEIALADDFDLDLGLLEELGLIKPHAAYYTSAQIGSFYITLSYDVGTFYRFQTIRLTQAGAAIVRLCDKELSEMLTSFSWPEKAGRFWARQSPRISPRKVRTLANTLVASAADAPEVDIYVRQEAGGQWTDIGRVIREGWEKPFGLAEATRPIPGGLGQEQFQVVLDVFDDFDKNTLKALGPNRQR